MCSGKAAQTSVYKLKKNQDYTKLLRNEHMYTPEQLEYMKRELKDALTFFGYSNSPHSEEEDTETSFFKYE